MKAVGGMAGDLREALESIAALKAACHGGPTVTDGSIALPPGPRASDPRRRREQE